MEKNFATRLDSIYSVFNSKNTAFYEEATQEFKKLVKEVCETKIQIIHYNKEHGVWDKVSPSCQFDFHKNGGISVFCKDFSQQDGVSKVFATNSYTGQIIAIKDCDKSLIISGD